jgi:hypothetical protein
VASNYTFSISLLNATSDPNSGLQIWQSGTLAWDTTSAHLVSGSISLPGFYTEQIDFQGTSSDCATGTLINASGKSSQAEITFSIVYNFDGFLYSGSYLGGLASMLDFNAQETYLYVMQGLSPQGPYGDAKRGGSKATDDRKASSSAD